MDILAKKPRLEVLEEIPPLPQFVSSADYIKGRFHEVHKFLKELEGVGGSKRSFQKLPKERRRRAMSHNPYRVPLHIRFALLSEMAKAPPAQSRRRRRDRRVPSNLLERRRVERSFLSSSKTWWLDTHMYHCKRFRMEKVFGFSLPATPSTRGQRAQYRALRHATLIHDRSYQIVLRVEASNSELLCKAFLQAWNIPLSVTNIGVSGARRVEYMAKQSVNLEENTCVALGPIQIIFRNPCVTNDSSIIKSEALVFSHVACIREIHNSLDNVIASSTEFSSLKSSVFPLSQFEVIGSKSLTTLARTIKLARHKINKSNQISSECLVKGADIFKGLINERFSLSQVSPGTIIPLDIHIPLCIGPRPPSRFIQKQTSSQQLPKENDITERSVIEVTSGLDKSQIWDNWRINDGHDTFTPSVRSRRRHNVKSILAKLDVRANTLNNSIITKPSDVLTKNVKGICLTDEEKNIAIAAIHSSDSKTPRYASANVMSKIPVLLVKKGAFQVCSSSIKPSVIPGWDIILPSGRPALNLFILLARISRVIGFRDRAKLLAAHGVFDFPFHAPPGCLAGQRWEAETATALLSTHIRLPPAKRTNYKISRSIAAFAPAWSALCERPTSPMNFSRVSNAIRDVIASRDVSGSRPDISSNCMVGVRLSVQQRGAPSFMSHIQRMSAEDMFDFFSHHFPAIRNDKHHTCTSSGIHLLALTNPPPISTQNLLKNSESLFFSEEKIATGKHKKERRKNRQLQGALSNEDRAHIKSALKKADVQKKFWLPDSSTDIPEKKVIGFVQAGGVPLTTGIGFGVGHVLVEEYLISLKDQIEVMKNLNLEVNDLKKGWGVHDVEVLVWIKKASSTKLFPAWMKLETPKLPIG